MGSCISSRGANADRIHSQTRPTLIITAPAQVVTTSMPVVRPPTPMGGRTVVGSGPVFPMVGPVPFVTTREPLARQTSPVARPAPLVATRPVQVAEPINPVARPAPPKITQTPVVGSAGFLVRQTVQIAEPVNPVARPSTHVIAPTSVAQPANPEVGQEIQVAEPVNVLATPAAHEVARALAPSPATPSAKAETQVVIPKVTVPSAVMPLVSQSTAQSTAPIVAPVASDHSTQATAIDNDQQMIRSFVAWRSDSLGDTTEAVRRVRAMLQGNEKSLNWSNLRLTTLPSCLGQLSDLEKLDVSHNLLTELPEELGQLVNLKELDAQGNRLENVTEAVTQLVNLKQLVLENNHLTALPIHLDRMLALRELRVNKNRLTALPLEIAELTGLLEINAAENCIKEIPSQLFGSEEGLLIHLQNNLIPSNTLTTYEQALVKPGYQGPKIYLNDELNQAITILSATDSFDPITSRSPERRIQLLLEAAVHLTSNIDGNQQSIYLGNRNMTRKDCYLMALETVLVHQRSQIPLVSHHLIHDFPPDIERFDVFGTTLHRNQINDWAQQQNLPVEIPVDVVTANVENEMHRMGSQNVHHEAVIVDGVRQLNRIKDRVKSPKSLDQTQIEIEAWLRTSNAPLAAATGLQILMGRKQIIAAFNESPASAMALLWTHISNTKQQPLKDNLLAAMQQRLVEMRNVCSTGMIQRVIQIPTAIDWSLTSEISPAQLRFEMLQLAAEVHDEFESLYGDQPQATEGVQRYIRPRPIDLSHDAMQANVRRTPLDFTQCEPLLIEAIETGQGVYEFVSRRAQLTPASAACKPLQSIIESENIGRQTTHIQLKNRYRLENFERIQSTDALTNSDHTLAQLTVRDSETNERCQIPFTQTGLKFTDHILRREQVERADDLLNRHMKRASEDSGRPPAQKKLPIIVSAFGRGRPLLLLGFHEILRGIRDGIVNTEADIDTALEQMSALGPSDGKRFQISDAQITELKIPLQHELEKVHKAQQDSDEKDAATSSIKRQMFQLKAKVQLEILRGLDADLISMEAERIFPADLRI